MMLKMYLLPSLGLPSSLTPATALFYHHASSCGVCVNARRVAERVYLWKISPHVNHVKKLLFLGSRALDLWVQKQLYLWNGTGYPYQIWNEHRESIDKVESSKKFFADLYYISTCTVTNDTYCCSYITTIIYNYNMRHGEFLYVCLGIVCIICSMHQMFYTLVLFPLIILK